MYMLKGIIEIDNIINEFLGQFDCTATIGTDFEYIYTESLIHYTFVVSGKSEIQFMNSINRCNPKVTCDIFLWSILHELGHHETIDDLTDDDAYISYWIKCMVNEKLMDENEYYDCPDEKAATEWAVSYANSHIEELSNLWIKLQAAIMNFYIVNEIEI